MGLGTAAVKLFLELRQRQLLTDTRSVLDMGAQNMGLSLDQFDGLVRAAGISDYDEGEFVGLEKRPGRPPCSARSFYRTLGIDEYACLDLGGQQGARVHDLNMPFTDSALYGHYDLVTDFGNNEHVFNIPETYRTIHRLCRPGGLMTVIQCIYGGNGYYNFDLSFFEGMAAANGYQILFSSFVINVANAGYHIPLFNELLSVVEWSKGSSELGICYVFKKGDAEEDFKYPYQGMFLAKAQGHQGYRLQFLPDPPSRTYIPMPGVTLDVVAGRALLRALIFRSINKVKALGRRR